MTEQPPLEGSGRRIFTNGQTLKIDVTRVSSGRNNKFHPQTSLEAAALLRPQISDALNQQRDLASMLKSSNLYFELRLLPNYLSASAFPERLASFLGADLVGVRSDEGLYRTKARPAKPAITKRLIFSSKDNALLRLERLVNGEETDAVGVRAFDEDLRKIDQVNLAEVEALLPARDAADPTPITWEAVLHPQGVREGRVFPLDDEHLQKWHEVVRSLDGDVHGEYERSVGGITFSPVTLTVDKARALSRFNGLRALRPLPKIRPRPGIGLRSATGVRPPGSAIPLRDDIRIAVFDGGIEQYGRRPALFPVSEFDITPEPADRQDLAHGTAVVGAALYGLVKAGSHASRPPAHVDSYRVFPAPDIDDDLWGYWMLDRIVEIIRQGNHQIVNLSLGPEKAVEDFAEPDRWTSELDQLAHEEGVLFIVAAGNGGQWAEWDADGDFHRVQVPADMVNGLSVGSCTLPHPEKRWQRAAYSSMGPGRHGARIQPTGVQYGGTEDDGMPLLRGDGSIMRNHGTSFAAPLMTNSLAKLAAQLPGFNANTLRSFAVHFAERHRSYKAKVNEFGFGRFLTDYTDKLDSEAHEVHVLFEDSAVRSSLLGYQIPLPNRDTSDLELRITLAYTSTVDIAQSTDYTNSSIDLTFRPHSEMRSFTAPDDDGSRIVLDRRSDEALLLLTQGWKDSQESPAMTLTPMADKSEAKLRESGKWETLRHYRVKVPQGKHSIRVLRLAISRVVPGCWQIMSRICHSRCWFPLQNLAQRTSTTRLLKRTRLFRRYNGRSSPSKCR
jgi:subtilisin family serine protease